jgi:hypothetical protein
MSIRSEQKTRLKAILETIQYKNASDVLSNIYVTNSYESNPVSYPYFFIQSAYIKKIEWLDNSRYKYKYGYLITLAFSVEDAMDQVAVDTLEQEFLRRLTQKSTRDQNTTVWQDIDVIEVTEMGQSDINVQDNIVLKVFTIEVETLPIYN